ncbi:hypothetical protein J6590_008161, partial [Homalodisca vitripennis]
TVAPHKEGIISLRQLYSNPGLGLKVLFTSKQVHYGIVTSSLGTTLQRRGGRAN